MKPTSNLTTKLMAGAAVFVLGTTAWAANMQGLMQSQAAKPGSVIILKGNGNAAPTPTPTPTPAVDVTPTPAPAPAPAPSGKPLVLSEGDSISAYWSGNHTGLYAKANPSVNFTAKAVGGSSLASGANSLEGRFAADAALKPQYVTILIGANDLTSVTSADAWLDSLWAYTAKWKAAGVKIAVGTVLPICVPQNATYTNEHATRRRIVNAAIRAAVSGKIDAVIDFAAEPTMGPDAAACDTKLYSDGIHPTDGTAMGVGGQGKLATVYTAALNDLMRK